MMARSTRALLVEALAEGYASLRRRLTARLGSQDAASEALHETFLDLSAGRELEPVANPDAYIYQAAIYKAGRLRRREQRFLDTVEIGALLDLVDEAPGPDRISEARDEMRRLRRILAGMKPRQRTIFVECYLGNATYAALAERFDVSERTVQADLRDALIRVVQGMTDRETFKKTRVRVSNR